MQARPSPRNFILFDLDGTLIDGVDDLVAAMNVVLRDQAQPAIDRPALEPLLGDGMSVLTRRVFAQRGVQLEGATLQARTLDYLNAYKDTSYRHTRLFDGVVETLQGLKAAGWIIGLASNKLTEPCRQILERLQILELFDVVAGGDATSVRKPDAGHLVHALEALGYDAARGDRAVMVGDHSNDIVAARGCGAQAIAVAFETDPTRANSLQADAVLTDFRSLPDALERLSAQ